MTFLKANVYLKETIGQFYNLTPKMGGRRRTRMGGDVLLHDSITLAKALYLPSAFHRLQSQLLNTFLNNFSEETTDSELLTEIVPAFQESCFSGAGMMH